MLIFVCNQLHEAMKNAKIFRFFLCFLIFSSPLFLRAQDREVDFTTQAEGDALRFIPQTPPLEQIAGAPPAFWRYYWEFGDGTFSFEEQPLHGYTVGGEYTAMLVATGNYDDGKPPRKKPKKVNANSSTWASDHLYPHVLKGEDDALGLDAVRNPRPGESFILILSYHNPTNTTVDGQLSLSFNERAFGYDLFTFAEARTHYGETPAGGLSMLQPQDFVADGAGYASVDMNIPFAEEGGSAIPGFYAGASAAAAQGDFGDTEGWFFQDLQAGETRNLFISLSPTEDMVQDTNVVISLQAQILSSNGALDEIADLDITILSSHDPNYLAVDKRRRSYRGIRHKKFKYEAHFQNNGDGPANKIRISVDLPEGLNPESVEVLDYYPDCPICPKGQPIEGSCLDTALYENRVEFTFHNIYLPGLKQEGVSQRDSTKGFVRYKLKVGKKTEKRTMKSRAAIYFDNDAPIVTRPAKTHFKWGVSPGIVVGRAFYPDTVGQWRMGFTAAPYKPYKPYFQFEMYAGVGYDQTHTETSSDTTVFVVDNQIMIDSIYQVDREITTQRFSTELVPLHLRYNLGGFMAVGGGVSVEWARESHQIVETRSLVEVCEIFPTAGPFCTTDVGTLVLTDTGESSSNYFAPSVFGELSLGAVRVGPSVGLRAYVPLSDKRKFYLTGFAIWRF